MKDDESLLTLKEVIARFKVSRSTVLRMIKRKQIKAHKVGNGLRFYENDVRNAVRIIGASEVRNQVEPIDTEGN